ncbi:hypothetical protein J6590_081260, partial [Homalodisca vitripennis]
AISRVCWSKELGVLIIEVKEDYVICDDCVIIHKLLLTTIGTDDQADEDTRLFAMHVVGDTEAAASHLLRGE